MIHRAPNKPLQILLVLTEFPPSIGGMQAHAVYLSRYLADRGYTVNVVTYRTGNIEEQQAARDFDDNLDFPVDRVLSRLSYWHNIDILTRLARQFNPDLIYCSTVFYGILRHMVDIPIICRSAGNDVLRPWIAYPFKAGSRLLAAPHLDKWLYHTFKKLNYPELVETLFHKKRHQLVGQSARQMDLVIANSQFTADLLDELGVQKNRVEIAVGGVDAQRFAPNSHIGANNHNGHSSLRNELGIREDDYLMITVCRLVAKKGIDFLLQTFKTVHQLMPDTHLLIMGDGHHSNRYQRLAIDLGLSGSVTFGGSVNHQDIQKYYWISDLFVLASRIQVDPLTGVKDAETMGRVLCEANAAGVPVLAARSGGIPSVIHHEQNGLLFEPDDEPSFIQQLQCIRTNTHLRQQVIETGLDMANQKFDWSNILQAHENYFKNILDKKWSDAN